MSEPSETPRTDEIPPSHIGGKVQDAFRRLFSYLSYIHPSAPRDSVDPYQFESSYAAEDLRRIADEIRDLERECASLRESLRLASKTIDRIAAIMVKPAGNKVFMQIAGPARQVLNEIGCYHRARLEKENKQ